MELKITDRTIRLRKSEKADLPVLREIYASTRKQELEQVPHWSDLMKTEFINQQFQAQHVHYQANYADADFWIIEINDQVAGRLYVNDRYQNATIRIIDITLLPAFRRLGLGTAILKDLMQYAAVTGLPVSIHVESFNPAKKLYERLGFKKISETNGVYQLMEWKPTI